MAENHHDEYNDNVTALLELIWGRGFLAPGGKGNVQRIVDGVDIEGRTVLEFGSGIGGGALVLAADYGARVIGLEIEAPLVERARRYAEEDGLADRVEFRLVEPGPLEIEDSSIDVVYSSGVIIHIEDKPALFADVMRVLKPGGVFTAYDWLKSPGPLSDAMHEWIKLEELTFHLDTLGNYDVALNECGFVNVTTSDASAWYSREAKREHERMQGPLFDIMTEKLGPDQRDHFLADWAALVRVLERGELRMGYFRGYKPA